MVWGTAAVSAPPFCFVQRVFYVVLMQNVHVSLDRSHLQLLAALQEFGRVGDAARSLHLSPSGCQPSARRGGTAGRGGSDGIVRPHVAAHAGGCTSGGQCWVTSSATSNGRCSRRSGSAAVNRAGSAWRSGSTIRQAGCSTPSRRPSDRRVSSCSASVMPTCSDAVRQRAADIAIAPWPKRPTGLQNTALASDVLVAAVPAGSALADGDAVRAVELYERTFLTSDYRAARGFEFHEFFLVADVVPATVVQVQSLEMMLRLVGNGDGGDDSAVARPDLESAAPQRPRLCRSRAGTSPLSGTRRSAVMHPTMSSLLRNGFARHSARARLRG